MLITIGAFMAAAYKIIPGIVKVINISGQMKAYEFALNDLEENKKTTSAMPLKRSLQDIHSVEFKNISFQYESQPVLDNFSFTIKRGDFIGITGESGKGKTTILNLLLGFLPATKGEVLINDMPVDNDEIKSYWPFIAYVRQQNFFIHDTLLRNITLEEEGFDKENLQYAIDISGIEKVISKFPEGIEKVITENGKNISGGQRQRIVIARALYKNADLIILDEPFSHIMPLHIEVIKEILQKEKQTKGILITDHMHRHITQISDYLYLLANRKTHLTKSVQDLVTLGYTRG